MNTLASLLPGVLTRAIQTPRAPWHAWLTPEEHTLILYFLGLAAFAMFAGFLRAWMTRDEVGSRYRPAVVARLCVTGIALISYLFIFTNYLNSYRLVDGTFRPTADAIYTLAPRYIDWSLTVPLLAFELLAVCTIVGAVARRSQYVAMACAFLMIFTGFLGNFVFGGGESLAAMLIFGGISCVFWIITNIVLIRAVLRSMANLTPEAGILLRQAMVLLLGGWVLYPLIALIQIFAFSGLWTTIMQISLCVADIIVKIGLGTYIHRVAKLRTAEDVRAGDDVHHESIWISSVKQSDAGTAPAVYLAEGAAAHRRREMPPTSTAGPGEPSIDPDEFEA